MKKINLVLILTFIAGLLAAQNWTVNLPQGKAESGDLTFYDIQKAFNDYWEPYNMEENGYYTENGEKKKAVGWKQFRRWEYYWADRIVKETGQFPKTSTPEELEKYKMINPGAKSASGYWTSLGPSSTSGGYAGLGRINCIGFVSGDNNTLYVGAASGGIWKTTNAGTSWTPIGDNNAVLGVSDIVVVPGTNPHTIYIATGDKNGGSMWSLGGGQYNDNNSVGILKSTDGGLTWNTTGLSFTPSQQRTVNRLLLHPTNNSILYAATSVGVYKTTNAGSSWTLITSNVFADMEFKPGTPATIYGSNYGGDVYRSTNDGSTWTMTLSTTHSRTEIAVTENNTAVVYAVVSNSSSGLAGIYKSTDSGATFSQVFSGSTTNLLNWDCNSTTSGGQAWYDLCIAADPTNANNVFVGGVNTWRSTNGGTSWSISNHWTGSCSVNAVHADKHYLAYQNGTSTLWEGNDGGVYRTTNNGSSWTHRGSGLVTSQIYRLGVAQTVANETIIGLQDNGTKAFLSGAWYDELGGDGFECFFDYTNQNTIYGSLYYGALRRSTNHGSSWSTITSGLTGSAYWCTPFVIDPNVNTTLYVGYQDVFKSTNQGSSWTKISNWNGTTLRSLAVAPSNSGYIYAATPTILYRTTNGGSTWTNITGSIPVGSGNITYVSVKHNDPNTVWVSLGNYNSSKVYQTVNGGSTWTNISAGLPSIPVMCVIQNKQNTTVNELYAGTDAGVYVKSGSANWIPFSTGLPNVVVTELEIYYATNPANSRIRAATYGRGLWQSDLLTSVAAPVANFSASTTTPNVGQTVTFTDLSSNSPTSWSWSFSPTTITYAGGTSSSSQNPQVQFNAGGFYTVTLTATNTGGSGVETKTNYIFALAPPVANFTANITNPAVGQTVTFTDQSTNTPTSWSWSFAPATVSYVGGTNASSQNPQVHFNAGGSYSVTLVASNAAGSGQITKTNYISVLYPPVADFDADDYFPQIGNTVYFWDLSLNNPTSWLWAFSPPTVTFVGGTSANSQYPEVQFNSGGSYAVTLTATNASGSNAVTKTDFIIVPYPPVADFSAGTTNPAIAETVTFTDLTTNNPFIWLWSFSPATVTYVDGTNMSSQNPNVKFNAGGLYTVTLTATGAGGTDSETKTDYVSVLYVPIADFEVNNSAPLVGETVSFTDLSLNNPTAWLWEFNPPSVIFVNSTSAISQHPGVQFTSGGTYSVTLTATNASGSDSHTKTDFIQAINPVIELNLTVFLEGPFNGSGMLPHLGTLMPLTQPYNVAPWNYSGTENVAAIPANVVDWILVELRDATSASAAIGTTMVDRQAAFLLADGSIAGLDGSSNLTFPNSITQQLFVVIWHRNHLGIMSANAFTLAGGVHSYDFTTGATQVHGDGDGHKQLPTGVWGMVSGDGDRNGQIGSGDKSGLWDSQAGTEGYIFSDYNLDGQSNNIDKDEYWVPNLGKGSQVPN